MSTPEPAAVIMFDLEDPAAPINLILTWEQPDRPTLIGRAFCDPQISTAWWGYLITRGDGTELDRGVITLYDVPSDPLDGIEQAALELLGHLRSADL